MLEHANRLKVMASTGRITGSLGTIWSAQDTARATTDQKLDSHTARVQPPVHQQCNTVPPVSWGKLRQEVYARRGVAGFLVDGQIVHRRYGALQRFQYAPHFDNASGMERMGNHRLSASSATTCRPMTSHSHQLEAPTAASSSYCGR